ncbi:hypothetical protein JCM10213_002819 [Rhodosporidiobolus nylandii]
MDSLGLGRRTPVSARKVSHSEYIRAISAADTPLRETVNTLSSAATVRTAPTNGADDEEKPVLAAASSGAQTPARRRRSRVDRTPAQVKAVLTERKRRSSAGLLAKQGKELTPGGLLRALSRMPDLPPPTPDDPVNDPTKMSLAASSSRRDSYIPKRSSLLASGSQHPSSAPATSSPVKEDSPQAGPSQSSPHSTPSSIEVADTLLASQRLSRSFSQRPSLHSPAASEASHSRRSSIASVASVEAARRASVVPEDLSRFLVRRKRMTDVGSEKGEETMMLAALDEEEEGVSTRYSLGPEGRFSMGSELGRELSFAHTDGTANSPGQASFAGSRLSLASAYGSLSAGRLSLPVSLNGERQDEQDLDEEEELGGMAYEDGEDGFQQHDFGGGFDEDEERAGPLESELDGAAGEEDAFDDEDLGDRIPWEEKGKGRASDADEFEPDMLDGVEDVWMTAGEGAGEDGFGGPLALPTPPQLAQVAENRKKRLGLTASKAKKAKKQRYSRTGEPVPDLPKSRQKALFQHFLGPGIKLDDSGVEALLDASQDFFASLMHDATAAAGRAGRTASVNESDVVRAMHDHRLLTSHLPLPSLARQLGVDRELQTVIDSLSASLPVDALGISTSSGRKRVKSGGGKGKKRLEAVVEEEASEEEEQEDEALSSPPPSPPKKQAKKRAAPAATAPAKRAPLAAKAKKDTDGTAKKRRRSSGTDEGRAKKRAVRSRRGSKKDAEDGPLGASSGDEADVFSD